MDSRAQEGRGEPPRIAIVRGPHVISVYHCSAVFVRCHYLQSSVGAS